MFSDPRHSHASSPISQFSTRPVGWIVIGLLGLSTLTGCVMTGAAVHPAGANAVTIEVRHATNAADIVISEGDLKERPYVVLGDISAWGRAVNLLSSNPTRADVDEALRAQAAKLGADAVILVRYHSARTGLAPRDKLTGEGRAIAFKD